MVATAKKDAKASKKENTEKSEHSAHEAFKSMASKMPKIDHEAILSHHKKNLDALSDAQKMAVDVIKNIAQLQTQFMRQTFEEMQSSFKEVMQSPASKEKLKAHADNVKQSLFKAVDHHSNISDIVLKSHKDVYSLVQDRFKDGAQSLNKHSSRTH
ncbi:phasin family protein [Candidatus Finniella inopinata]|uniref:Phasin family protein n=1 Tax=Candidatus Finniella inopinata TaxID=1696036 RepID=A0A4Q7DH96_9PROT|nr:phasin family protein [Candidatus Finniella inopinata]RZI45405.1 phasin family protein [Candidatus Finniella inopinata]